MNRRPKQIYCEQNEKTYASIRACARDLEIHNTLISKALKRKGETKGYTFKYVESPNKDTKKESSWDESKDKATYSYRGTKRIITLEDALDVADVDMDVWEVERWVKNSWEVTSKNDDNKHQTTTNHQVKIWFKKKLITDYALLVDNLDDKTYSINYIPPTNGEAYLGLADFHIGALVQGLDKTQDFSSEILIDRLNQVLDYVNSKKFSKVYVGMLGDFIESFTGLNHLDSWKSMEHGNYGGNAVINASEILSYFLSNVRNLNKVGLVSGNHDRVTASKDGDTDGDVGKILHYILDSRFDVDIDYNPYVLTEVIDGVCYVQYHGHNSLSKNAMADILFSYGKQNMYNVIVQGHLHSRKKKEAYRVVDGCMFDKLNYRSITLPPMFTGNSYSERSGWTSSAGFNLLYKNSFGKLEQLDVML